MATVPAICGQCKSRNVVRHCGTSPTCTWVYCHACHFTTGIICGQVRSVPGTRRHAA